MPTATPPPDLKDAFVDYLRQHHDQPAPAPAPAPVAPAPAPAPDHQALAAADRREARRTNGRMYRDPVADAVPPPAAFSLLDPDPPGWRYNREPHPAHGPAHLLPRDADGRLSAYYYCSPQEIAAGDLTPPNFAVERRIRADGITPEKQQAFLLALAETASVATAARQAGVSRQALYRLRNAPHAHAFRAAWAEALKAAVAVLADTAFQRAVEGVEEPVYWRGEQVGWHTRYNDRLLMFLLRVRDPASYAPLRELGAWKEIRPIEPQGNFASALTRLAETVPPEGPPPAALSLPDTPETSSHV